MTQLATTRRAMLGAMAAAPVALAVPAAAAARPAKPDRRAWEAAMERYERAKAASKVAGERHDRTAATYEAITGTKPYCATGRDEALSLLCGFTQIDNVIDDYGEAESNASTALVEMPAPDIEALNWKLDYLFGEDARSGDEKDCVPGYCSQWMDVVLSDTARLAGRS